jgi:hypothetical protein
MKKITSITAPNQEIISKSCTRFVMAYAIVSLVYIYTSDSLLQSIANETGTVIIASSQLSRSVETRKESKVPTLSDLRESGSIEQDADKVIMLYRPEYYGISNDALGETLEGETHLHIAKNRYGNVGVAKLRMNAEKTGFIDMEDYFGGSKLFRSEFTFSAERKDEIR